MTPYTVAALLETHDDAVRAALLCLYGSQTPEERSQGSTKALNGIGFNAYDAPELTPLAKRVGAGRQLADFEIRIARRRLGKYAVQLANAGALDALERRLVREAQEDPFAAVELAAVDAVERRRARRV